MQSEFNFFQQWYPVSPVEDIDPQKPTSITVLGIRLVIWKPKSSDYQVFLDKCPHRLAPLSEGRVDEKTGNLMCSYHGWEFDAQGICTRIPQADNPQLVTKNQQQLCAVSLPVRQDSDLLWVWLDANSPQLATETLLPLSPQIDASKGFVWSSYVRDLEYDWQTLIENVADPSHVPFTHHGVQGNREQAGAISFEIVKSAANLIEANTVGRFETTITFEPPCRLEYKIRVGKEGKQLGLVTYCIPTYPGKSRIVALFTRNFAAHLNRIIPRWWSHIKIRNQVLDGDMIILHQQERFLQERQSEESWKTAYQLPTNADRLIIEFRKWFDKYSQGKLPWDKVGIEVPQNNFLGINGISGINENRKELLDRYKQHTQICSSCRNAVKFFQHLQVFCVGYFAIIISIVAILPDALRIKFGLPLMLTGLFSLAGFAGLKFWLIPQFYFQDYLHPEKD
ncbi:MAG: Rieske 2Fe-2S domain-containing protein [Rivularia sp. ALOHA_DT_140]|nr:Rieske 2Fe-2S domain-containing protein [Rivularia sp. ALOHA_DT_140]